MAPPVKGNILIVFAYQCDDRVGDGRVDGDDDVCDEHDARDEHDACDDHCDPRMTRFCQILIAENVKCIHLFNIN